MDTIHKPELLEITTGTVVKITENGNSWYGVYCGITEDLRIIVINKKGRYYLNANKISIVPAIKNKWESQIGIRITETATNKRSDIYLDMNTVVTDYFLKHDSVSENLNEYLDFLLKSLSRADPGKYRISILPNVERL
ncbi:MAG: hypothetical protein LIO79_08215 [Rikenellaceae bacterium]|nr:hypothetical protein [Rikenellaceae bacterium]